MINAEIREFENDIINYVNACESIPVEVKYLVFKDILHQIESEANRNVIAEREQMEIHGKPGKLRLNDDGISVFYRKEALYYRAMFA